MPKRRNTNTEVNQAAPVQNENNNIIVNQPNNGLSEVNSLDALPTNPMEIPELAAHIAHFVPTSDVLTIIDENTGEKSTIKIDPLADLASKTNRLFYHLTQPRHLASKLLLLTAQGKEDEVAKFFALSPHLIRTLIAKNEVEDYSGRRFKDISVFQYALWARDWHMWEMMLKALNEAELKALTDEEWSALPEQTRNKFMTFTKAEIGRIRTTLKQQYDEVIHKGLDYTISRMDENNQPMTVQIKGETHFDLVGPEFCLMPEEANFVPEKGKIYVKIEQDLLHYTLISLSGEPVTASIGLEHLAPLTKLSTNEDIKPFITPILKMTALRGHTHPQALISSLKTYCEQCDNWEWEQRENHWCHVVGMAQREMPANIAQEYCRTDLALGKERSFTELVFPRTLEFDNWINDKIESWFPLHVDNKLGDAFAIYNYRCVARVGRGHTPMWAKSSFRSIVGTNLEGLLALCKVRSKQVIELGGRLSQQAQQEIGLAVDSCMSYS